MKKFTIFLLLIWCSSHTTIVAQQGATTDTVNIVDDEGRIIKRLKNGYVVEEIEYPKSKPILVADVETILPWFKNKSFTYTFQAKDIVVIEVKPVGKNRLHEVRFSNSKGGILFNELDIHKKECFCKRIEIEETDDYTLTIRDLFVKIKGKASISIIRYPKTEAVVYNIVRDTVYSEKPDSVIRSEVVQRDTLLYQLVDESYSITNKLDIERKPYETFRISIPLDDLNSIKQLYYWIGLSREDTLYYQELEAKIVLPAPLVALTTTPALVAYALNERIPLPKTQNQNIHYAFTDLNNKMRFHKRHLSYQTLAGSQAFPPPNFGRISLSSLRSKYSLSAQTAAEKKYDIPPEEAYHIFLNFRNNSSVNTYPIQVKVIGLSIKETKKDVLARRILDLKTYRVRQIIAE